MDTLKIYISETERLRDEIISSLVSNRWDTINDLLTTLFKSISALPLENDQKAINQALHCYKYFRDKKDLLYQVLNEHFMEFYAKIGNRIANEATCIEQLEVIIFSSLESYAENRLLSKMLLLEVRNSLEFFTSDAYGMVRKYAAVILETIEKGIEAHEIKPQTDAFLLRKVILGSIEHACLGEIIFGREVDIDQVSSGISDIIFNGVKQ